MYCYYNDSSNLYGNHNPIYSTRSQSVFAIDFTLDIVDNTMAKSPETQEMQLQLALEACRKAEKPNFSAVAREFPPVNRHTLRRRFLGQQTSRKEANAIHHQNLLIEEEEELIAVINKLTARGLPPTSQIVRNLAEEMVGRTVGKNWTGQFV